ncbi:MAG: class I SAM-dependent methyltransferase [Anaerolineae bacterium]
MTRICDYQDSCYRYQFWESQDRRYEDIAERIALRALLPPIGGTLIEVGAGFGRLASLYQGYRRVVLMDYARSQLEEAKRYLPQPERYIMVVADVYNLPFADNLFDAITLVRVMHHLADVPRALAELHRVARPDGVAVIEHANKRHWKAIARWLLRRQSWSPFDLQPVEFATLHFDFHPAWVRQRLHEAGFTIERTRSVSHFRLPLLKRVLPPTWLAALDGLLQPSGNWLRFAPSLFLRARALKPPAAPPEAFFICPACHHRELIIAPEHLRCPQCDSRWSTADGIYDLRTPY